MLTAGGACSPVASPGAASLAHWLSGCDETPGIVSVAANTAGRARVWRRAPDGRLEMSEHRFTPWFLTTSTELLAHLAARALPAEQLRASHGAIATGAGLQVVQLEGGAAEALRYVVLADSLDELEAGVLDTWNKRTGSQARSLADLHGVVAVWPPVEQFLLLTGRTYFKGMEYRDLRRLQFDLETTGLDEQRDRIFMVSLRDSSGWRASLDTASMTEAALLERFVQLVQERDPDVLENHNIFAFDLPFLARRAARLGVRLALGRDGSAPTAAEDTLHVGSRTERFVRWRVAGREVVDTLQAVKRHAAAAPDLRRHGLKEAARYFGLARPDREYVSGPEVWPTFQRDPDRVRRYAADDVEEADGLSRRLMPIPFYLSTLLPRPYERVAADASPPALFDPLLVRASLHEGRALPVPSDRTARGSPGATRPRLFARGVVRQAIAVEARPLFSRLLVEAAHAGGAPCDPFTLLLGEVLARQAHHRAAAGQADADAGERAAQVARADALAELAEGAFPYLASPGVFFPDAALAAQAAQRGRSTMDALLRALEAHGATAIEVDGAQALLAVPVDWDEAAERALLGAGQALLPPGVCLERRGRYRAAYVRAERNRALLGYDGTIGLVGRRPGVAGDEPFGEQFVRHAAALLLRGDLPALRRLFLETVARLRAGEVAVAELCTQATLRKSPAEYRQAASREEPYEVLLVAGVRSWRTGQRVRYFRDRGGQPRLVQEGDAPPPTAADAEHYVQRLHGTYCHYFAHAFRPEHFQALFRLPLAGQPAGEADEADLAGIQPVLTCVSLLA